MNTPDSPLSDAGPRTSADAGDGNAQLDPQAASHFLLEMLHCSPLACQSEGQTPVPEAFQGELGPELNLQGADGRWGSPLSRWLVDHFHHHPMHMVPMGQVEGVHALTPALFGHFHLEQGSLRLGGCTLEDRPVLRRTTIHDHGGSFEHAYFDLCGRPLDRVIVEDLGLTHVEPFHGRPYISPEQLAAWEQFVAQQGSTSGRHSDPHAPPSESTDATDATDRQVVCSILWCKYASGELNATDDEERLRLPFEGWASQLLTGRATPPPYFERATGDESYELVRLDDGSLTASTAAATCEASGKRVLRSELRTCPATGQSALPEFFVTCPVTSELVIDSALTVCQQCHQAVGSHCLDENGVCLTCRALRAAGPEDPRLARILGEHPGLNVWRRWRLAESSQVYVLTGSALLRQLLVVLDRESLVAKHLAVRSRFSRQWHTPSDLEQRELLEG